MTHRPLMMCLHTYINWITKMNWKMLRVSDPKTCLSREKLSRPEEHTEFDFSNHLNSAHGAQFYGLSEPPSEHRLKWGFSHEIFI